MENLFIEFLVKDTLVVMPFPMENMEKFDRTATVKALLDRKADIESTFKNNEYIKLDLTNQELVGIKNTSDKFSDYIALNLVTRNHARYKDSNILSLGNVNDLFEHCSL